MAKRRIHLTENRLYCVINSMVSKVLAEGYNSNQTRQRVEEMLANGEGKGTDWEWRGSVARILDVEPQWVWVLVVSEDDLTPFIGIQDCSYTEFAADAYKQLERGVFDSVYKSVMSRLEQARTRGNR